MLIKSLYFHSHAQFFSNFELSAHAFNIQCDDFLSSQTVKSRDKRLDETRGGFVLSSKSESGEHNFSILEKPRSLKRTLVNTLKLRKQRSTGDISDGAAVRHHKFSSSMRSTRSFASQNSTLSVESGMTSASKHTDFSDDQSFYSQVCNEMAAIYFLHHRCPHFQFDGCITVESSQFYCNTARVHAT